ncbi:MULTISPECIES: DUF3572 domain-containing protein [unclassified Ruegeria]|uniref:DUF3572 domain-containing protein n=1 Tax=unclassified Ruegeria TaxID=2625375 RepID=UPI00148876CD|nr:MULTISPECIES: DUF3572 domain-containing protein [unclassified Ruegeria]NOD34819.1 DUF3572 family protein [Ruegeria sp. HKCCD7296]NOD48435.1 DUF3572 family protein [Ruegeria sp. HKCCD5849]NOD52455.1 DUF3572 family protein [Ruegeria sp. HKCCD5851]NOD68558.1 DUF3572 family protein [Ruegeria sp. HKCCD7303]NOE34635.1 DUF3572 family protein [Ruegeria sp. HKCCD7318]
MPISSDSAETLALTALGWLVGNDELLPVFLGSTGASIEDVRDRAGDPDFLASVMDFLVLDDSWVMAFCDANAIAYDLPAQARAVLSGGADIHWT